MIRRLFLPIAAVVIYAGVWRDHRRARRIARHVSAMCSDPITAATASRWDDSERPR